MRCPTPAWIPKSFSLRTLRNDDFFENMQLYMDFEDPIVGALPPLEDVQNLCRDHFLNHHCRRGRNCPFQHVAPPGYSMEAVRAFIPCPSFLRGRCTVRNCNLFHWTPWQEQWKSQRDSSSRISSFGTGERSELRPLFLEREVLGSHRNDLQDLSSRLEEAPSTRIVSVKPEQQQENLARNISSVAEPNSAPPASPLLTCGICLEEFPPHGALINDASARPRHHRFGLLSDCNHSFCFQCLMDWRNPSFHHHVPPTTRMGDDDQRMEGQKSCPVCRKPSRYVIPSTVFPTSEEEKIAIVTRHKEGKAKIPCRYFNGKRGSCRFGSDCLYAHLNQRGHDVKALGPSREELQQRRRNRQARRAAVAEEEVVLSLLEIAELHLVLSQIRGLIGEVYDDYE